MADLLKPWKVPQIREGSALIGFDGLNLAILSFQKDTRFVIMILQCQPTSIGIQARVGLDKYLLCNIEVSGNSRDFTLVQANLAWPAAAGRTAFALVVGRHQPLSLFATQESLSWWLQSIMG